MTAKLHGCNNTRPDSSKPGGYVTESHTPEWVPDRFMKGCQWSRLVKNADAPGCVGCREKCKEPTL